MKITNHEIIKSGEKELIDAITGELDWRAIESIFQKIHNLDIQDDVELKSGDFVVYNNQVAYKLDFEVKVKLSVVLDRQGNYLSLSSSASGTDSSDNPPDSALSDMDPGMPTTNTDAKFETNSGQTPEDLPSADPDAEPIENITQMAAHIGEMISDLKDD